MYRIKNTANDRTKTLLHRKAPKFTEEPILGSRRIRLGEFVDIEDDHYERVKHMLNEWVGKGMVSVTNLSDETPAPVAEPLPPPPLESAPVGDDMSELFTTQEVITPVVAVEELTTVLEPAGAPVVEPTPPPVVAPAPAPTPVVEDRYDSKKSGKKKLF